MSEALKKSAQHVQDILQKHNLTIKVVEFPQATRTAQKAANVMGGGHW